jgi:Fe-S-cluster containining protein
MHFKGSRVSFGGVRRLRIAILGESPCGGCGANCCKQNGHAFAVLLEGEERRRFAAFSMDHPFRRGEVVSLERVIPYRDGRCPFLGPDDLCTIYEDRPANCRRFQCVEAFHRRGSDVRGHGVFLERNPDVLARLEKL